MPFVGDARFKILGLLGLGLLGFVHSRRKVCGRIYLYGRVQLIEMNTWVSVSFPGDYF